MLTSFICKGCGKPSLREKDPSDADPKYCTQACFRANSPGHIRGPVALRGSKTTATKPTKGKVVHVPVVVRARVRGWLSMPSLCSLGGLIE